MPDLTISVSFRDGPQFYQANITVDSNTSDAFKPVDWVTDPYMLFLGGNQAMKNSLTATQVRERRTKFAEYLAGILTAHLVESMAQADMQNGYKPNNLKELK